MKLQYGFLCLMFMASVANSGSLSITGDEGLEQYFLHINRQENSVTHMPRNTKGILFVSNLPGKSYFTGTEDGAPIGFMTRIPTPLRDIDFFVATNPGLQLFPTKITRMPLELGPAIIDAQGRRLTPEAPRRFFLLTNKYQKICVMDWAHAATNPQCRRAGIYPNAPSWTNSLVRQGKLKDISRQVEAASGLFRIGPAKGFPRPGAYWVGRVLRRNDNWLHPFITTRENDQTDWSGKVVLRRGNDYLGYSIIIDEEEVPPYASVVSFALEQAAAPPFVDQIKPTNSNANSDCESSSVPVMQQAFTVRLPDAYQPYRALMSYFVQIKQDQSASVQEADWQYVHDNGDIGNIHAQSAPETDSAIMACEPDVALSWAGAIRSEIGLLEVDDSLHITRPMHFSLAEVPGTCAKRANVRWVYRSQREEYELCR